MDYRIFTCNKTLALYDWGKDKFGLWIPVQRVRRDGKWHYSAAVPGYLFVPLHSEQAFRRNLPPLFNAAPLYASDGRTYKCDSRALCIMQEILNGAFVDPDPLPCIPGTIKAGDIVRVNLPIFESMGWEAQVEKLKPGNKARIMINGRFVDIDMGILQKIR